MTEKPKLKLPEIDDKLEAELWQFIVKRYEQRLQVPWNLNVWKEVNEYVRLRAIFDDVIRAFRGQPSTWPSPYEADRSWSEEPHRQSDPSS